MTDRSDLLIPIALLGVLVAVLAMGTAESSLSMPIVAAGESSPSRRVPAQGTEFGARELREALAAEKRPPVEAITRSGGRGMISLQGQVWRAGRPVPAYELLFLNQAAGLDGEELAWDQSDAQGRFRVRLPAGNYAVLAEETGPWLANLLVPEDQEDQSFDIHLPSGVIRGRVLAADGETPVPDAIIRSVAASMPAGDPSLLGLMSRDGETRSDRDGRFELADLRPGPHLLLAKRGGLSSRSTLVRVEGSTGSSIDLRLTSGEILRGRIIGPGGEPVAADLYLSPGSQLQSLNPFYLHHGSSGSSDGAFRLEGLQPGTYQLFAFGETAQESVALGTRVHVRPGDAGCVIRAKACGSLRVRVRDEYGEPVAGAHVDLRADDGSLVIASLEGFEEGPVSDDEGELRLDDVIPGAYRVAAIKAGLLGAYEFIELSPGEEARLDLLLR